MSLVGKNLSNTFAIYTYYEYIFFTFQNKTSSISHDHTYYLKDPTPLQMEMDFTDAEESTRPKLKRTDPSTIERSDGAPHAKIRPDKQSAPEADHSTPKTATGRPVDNIKTLTENTNPPPELLEGRTPAEQEKLRKNWVSIKHYIHGCISIDFHAI